MFNFTTQTVYNSLKIDTISTKGQKPAKGSNVIVSTLSNANGTIEPKIRIGNTRFTKGEVLDIQVKKPTPESLAKVTFDLSKLKTLVTADGKDTFAGSYRIALYLGLSMNSQDSFYANDFVYKGKPLYVEFAVNSEDEDLEVIAKRIIKTAKKYMLFVAQENILTIDSETTEGESGSTTITFEAVNGYQLIKKANIQKFHENPCGGCDKEGYSDIIIGVPVAYTVNSDGVVTAGEETLDEDGLRELADNEVAIEPGLEAFGDYNWIIHNLRLPTAANTYFWAVTKDEMPTVGATYKQYIIRICKERDGIGGEVVGQRATSVTTHVLYVNSADPNISTFEQALKSVLNKQTDWKTDADTALSDPYANA